MPRQNRVTPLSELVAHPARGLVYGNRGCLHDESGRVRRFSVTKLWISCRLEFKDWHRGPLMQPGRFTELFFLDEATAFAAGHRPCALCRRDDYNLFRDRWRALHPHDRTAAAIDSTLHDERLASSRTRRLHTRDVDSLVDGCFVLHDDQPWLVRGSNLLLWTPAGYTTRIERPAGARVSLVTPPSVVEVLGPGWQGAVPFLHPSADQDPVERAARPGHAEAETGEDDLTPDVVAGD
jgi:hypothetical protein